MALTNVLSHLTAKGSDFLHGNRADAQRKNALSSMTRLRMSALASARTKEASISDASLPSSAQPKAPDQALLAKTLAGFKTTQATYSKKETK